jgi:hypothetical protein
MDESLAKGLTKRFFREYHPATDDFMSPEFSPLRVLFRSSMTAVGWEQVYQTLHKEILKIFIRKGRSSGVGIIDNDQE